MSASLILLIPLLVALVVLVFAFAGCTPFKATPADPTKPPADGRPPYQDVILKTQGLVSYWRLSETSGSTADDIGPADRNAAYKGAVKLGQAPGALAARDPADKAPEFDGQAAHVETAWHGTLNPPKFSLEAWMKPAPSAAGHDLHHLVSSRDVAGQLNFGFALAVVRETAANPGIRGRVGTGQDAPNPRVHEVFASMPGGPGDSWRHVVMTFDGSALQLFVNGAPAATTAGVTYAPNTGFPFRIGAERISTSADAADFFAGLLDEVAFYNVALSATQVKEHFDAAQK